MTPRIRVGAMLIENGAQCPESLVVSAEPYLADWSCVTNSSTAELGREIERLGWTFFYMAGEIRANALGSNNESGMARAVAQIIKVVKLQYCNCLEITGLSKRTFLGLPYTSVVAHARHIQKSCTFQGRSGAGVRKRSYRTEWLYSQTRAVAPVSPLTGNAVQVWENEGGSRSVSRRSSRN